MSLAALILHAASPAGLAIGFSVALVLWLVAAEEIGLRRRGPGMDDARG